MTSEAPSSSILLVAPGCVGESSSASANAVVTGNRATARRIKGLLEKEAQGGIPGACRPTVVLCDVSEAESKLRSGGPWAAVVGVHATKAGPALDLAQAQGIPTVCVLGGTDVNVDMIGASRKAMECYSQRLRNCQCVVAFSPSVADALPATLRDGVDLRLAPQGVELGQLDHTGWAIARDELCTEVQRRFLACTAPLSTDGCSGSSTTYLEQQQRLPPCRLFMLPAHLRPIKDVCYVADAIDAAWAHKAPSSDGAPPTPVDGRGAAISVKGSREVAPSVVVLGHSLDQDYAQTCWNRAKTSSTSSSSSSSSFEAASNSSSSSDNSHSNGNDSGVGGGAFMVKDGLPRSTLLAAYADRSGVVAGVINTSVSEGMSGALLEAMACGCPVLARDIPGNRALLTSPSSSDSSKGNESTGKEFTNTGRVGSVAADNLASKTAAGSVVYREGKGWEEVESGYLFTTPASFVEAAEVVLRGEAVDVAARAQARAAAFSTAEVNAWGRIVNDLMAPNKHTKSTAKETLHSTMGNLTSPSPSSSSSSPSNLGNMSALPRALSVATTPLFPISFPSPVPTRCQQNLFSTQGQIAMCSLAEPSVAPLMKARKLLLPIPSFEEVVPMTLLIPPAFMEWRGRPKAELAVRSPASSSSSSSLAEVQMQGTTVASTNEAVTARAYFWPGIEMFLAL